MAGGPLIPGVEEFDRPRSGWPGWLTALLVVLAVLGVAIVVAGLMAGVGPLRSLGTTTTPLTAVGYRVTADPAVIEVAVTPPPSGLCRDDEVSAVAFERSNRVEVEVNAARGRRDDCVVTTLGGDVRWVSVSLDAPLGTRQVIRTIDREPLPREAQSGSA